MTIKYENNEWGRTGKRILSFEGDMYEVIPSIEFRKLLQSFEDRISKIENRYYYRSEDTFEEWIKTKNFEPVTPQDIENIKSKLFIFSLSEDHIEVSLQAEVTKKMIVKYKDMNCLMDFCKKFRWSIPDFLAYIECIKMVNPPEFFTKLEKITHDQVKSKKEPHSLSSRLRILEISGSLVKVQEIEGSTFYMAVIDTDKPKALDLFCNHFFECQVSEFLQFVEDHKDRLWEAKGKTI